jgi:nucleoside-diphosphate-sugar epimerase
MGNNRIIIDGANGYVASYFVKHLIDKDMDIVCLVRSKNDFSGYKRMQNSLLNIGCLDSIRNREKVQIHDYRLLDHDFGIPVNQLNDIFSGDFDYFHFAANLKYSSKDKDELFRTNREGVDNSIKIFQKYATPNSRYFLISTAYVCGWDENPTREIFFEDKDISHFRNYYEQSKRSGENVLRKYLNRDDNFSGFIIRLGQIVGESDTGITHTSYGVFDFFYRLFVFSRRYPNKRVRIRMDPEGTQNMISVNYALKCLDKIISNKNLPLPEIINLVSNHPIKNDYIAKNINDLLPIDLIQVPQIKRDEMNLFEKIVLAGMAFTGSYTTSKLMFQNENLKKVVQEETGSVTKENLGKMFLYFLENKVAM